MNIFDIMGPIMVGPSSSHTAGAARIGYITRRLLGSQPVKAELLLHGSFAATGAGHGTDKALTAGLLGMRPDDPRLPRSFELAAQAGMELTLGKTVLRGAHPNTVLLRVEDGNGKHLEVVASSLGGGRVKVCSIDGLDASFTGELPTLIIRNEDRPGMVAEVSAILSRRQVNIAAMQLYRNTRGGLAVMVIESDQPVWETAVEELRACPGIQRVTCLTPEEPWHFHLLKGCWLRPVPARYGRRCWKTIVQTGAWTVSGPWPRCPPCGRPWRPRWRNMTLPPAPIAG